ncbi:unnamed protein product [Lactuca virosa]|uniref:Oxysterol-binding protein n=1 Tax=Lactuca virosa TaxID=75947 RepID=A0AAU9MCH6_9ASTR|nr:unnamed protein product [Lactuca virosa]
MRLASPRRQPPTYLTSSANPIPLYLTPTRSDSPHLLLPTGTDQERDSYWRSMQKYVGADITSMVTLPVLIFEPMTMLQKMAELMEYAHLLEQADNCEDPYMRLVYTASWFISIYYALQRTWKPFNPILGETYEMVNHCGITFIAEQVSHHPPISVAHAENEHFVYDITSKVKTKFLGNSVDVYPLRRTRLKLKKDGVILELVPPPTKVNNLIFGRTWIDSPGEMVLTNLTSRDKVVLYFQPCGWFGYSIIRADPDDVSLRYHRASIYVELGNYHKAAESYEQIWQLRPQNLEALKTAAMMYQRCSQHDRIVSILDDYLRKNPKDVDVSVVHLLASMHMLGNAHDKALHHIEYAQQNYSAAKDLPVDLGNMEKA